eukprot:6489711-Amphidinium_carterae.1
MAGVSSNVPRPSSAPQETQVPVEDPASSPYYSPVPSPEAETVNSSSSVIDSSSSAQSPCSPPDLGCLEPLEAYETFKENVEMSASDTNKWWKKDPKMKIYQIMAPSWVDAIRHHSSVHLCSAAASEDVNDEGYVTMFLHSTRESVERLLKAGDQKSRFFFSSPVQCSLHRVAHDHFGLSNAKLLPGTVVMGVALK